MPRSRDDWIEILVAVVIGIVLLYAFVIQPFAAWASQNYVVGGIAVFLIVVIGFLFVAKVWLPSRNRGTFTRQTQTDTSVRVETPTKQVLKIYPPLSQREKEEIIHKAHTRCWYPHCTQDISLEVHHIIPRAEGGTNQETNLVVLCPTHHNLADSGTIPRERLRRYSVARVKDIA